MTPVDIPPSLLDRYLTGECSAEESEQVRAWLQTADLHKREFAFLSEIRSVAERTPVWDVRAMWKGVDAAVNAEEANRVDTSVSEINIGKSNGHSIRSRALPPAQLRNPRTWYTSVLAAVAMLLIVGAGAWRMTTTDQFSSESKNSLISTYSTANGERATVTLPDQSVVFLNAGSRVEVSADYGVKHRNVRLYGEALFTVVHQADHPFTVTTTSSTTRVLGTRFVVRQHATDTSATIAVEAGRVAVGSTILSANQEIVVGNGWVSTVQPLQAKRLAFTHGTLSFDRTPLVEAIPELNRWFDADVRIGDASLSSRILTGDIRARSVGGLVEILELVYNLRVVQSGRMFTLYPR